MNKSSDDDDLGPAEKEFEHALSDLPAAKISLDAQTIWAMSISHRQSHRLWFWRATSAALAASLMIVLWARRPHNTPPTQIVYVHDHPTNPSAQPIAPTPVAAWSIPTEQSGLTDEQADNYLRMRQRVMQKGLSVLTALQVPIAAHATAPFAPEPDAPADVERAIQPPPPGPVYRFIKYLDKGSQL